MCVCTSVCLCLYVRLCVRVHVYTVCAYVCTCVCAKHCRCLCFTVKAFAILGNSKGCEWRGVGLCACSEWCTRCTLSLGAPFLHDTKGDFQRQRAPVDSERWHARTARARARPQTAVACWSTVHHFGLWRHHRSGKSRLKFCRKRFSARYFRYFVACDIFATSPNCSS